MIEWVVADCRTKEYLVIIIIIIIIVGFIFSVIRLEIIIIHWHKYKLSMTLRCTSFYASPYRIHLILFTLCNLPHTLFTVFGYQVSEPMLMLIVSGSCLDASR